jgi:hypothetical protein
MNTNRDQSGIYQFNYRKPRVSTAFPLFVQAHPHLLEGRGIDISEDGLSASLPEPLAIESEVTLVLDLPGPHPYQRIQARVTHQQEKNHGFIFVFRTQAERDHLQESILLLSSELVRSSRDPEKS